jgi:hypothetical protein
MAERPVGPGRVLVACYALFVVAAGARSAVQLSTHASRAPVPYGLSALAAVVYACGLVLLVRADRHPDASRVPALACCAVELAGVVAVGLSTVVTTFPDDTVWSGFGRGYGFVPLLLPVLAGWWLLAGRRSRQPA